MRWLAGCFAGALLAATAATAITTAPAVVQYALLLASVVFTAGFCVLGIRAIRADDA